uniref:Uncharacterized protein n=1 Tax=Arundo donax TaxID=35708 RepID=A0A0A9HKY3_ARUDO
MIIRQGLMESWSCKIRLWSRRVLGLVELKLST